MTTAPDTSVGFVWAQYRRWAATSRRLDARANTMRAGMFALVLFGPILGAIGAQLERPPVQAPTEQAAARADGADPSEAAATPVTPPGAPAGTAVIAGPGAGRARLASFAALVSGVFAAVAAFLARQAAVGGTGPQATRARAVAEGLKSLAWRRAATPPAEGADDPAFEQASRIASAGDGILLEAITEEDRRKDCPVEPLTLEAYTAGRVEPQIVYYETRAAEHAGLVRRSGNWSLGIGIGAIVVTALSAYAAGQSWAISAAWGAVLGATGAAVSSWYQAAWHAQVAATYQRTATLIAAANARWRALPESRRVLVDLVNTCEDVFDAEHAVWRQATLEQAASDATRPPSADASTSEPSRPAPTIVAAGGGS